jgi:AI-2 transport system ATP-binding protein
VVIAGKSAKRRNPELCQHLGLVYLPEDRHTHGIFLDRPYIETATSSVLGQLGRPLLSSRREKTLGQSFVEQLQIKATSLFQQARTLSGGNQQKVVLAKCLASKPRVIILDEPTRGVDAKARQDVYHLVQKLTDQGLGVLLISSDLEEVIQLSDRVYIMYHGRIVEELMRNDCQMERITAASFGIKDEL